MDCAICTFETSRLRGFSASGGSADAACFRSRSDPRDSQGFGPSAVGDDPRFEDKLRPVVGLEVWTCPSRYRPVSASGSGPYLLSPVDPATKKSTMDR